MGEHVVTRKMISRTANRSDFALLLNLVGSTTALFPLTTAYLLVRRTRL